MPDLASNLKEQAAFYHLEPAFSLFRRGYIALMLATSAP